MDSNPTRVDLRGSCQCGAVRLLADLPSLWLAHCHCTLCRKAHGAGFVTWIGFAAERCQIEDSQHALRWYASSAGAERGFCSGCGSMLLFRSQRWPGELHVAVGMLDDAPDRAAEMHVHWADHVAWSGVDCHDGLPRKD